MAGSLELDLDDSNEEDEEEQQWWQKEGYLTAKELGGGLWLVIINMVTTYRLAVCDEHWVHEFWCYPHDLGLLYAFRAWDAFDGVGDPMAGWVKHHPSGRRR